MAHIDDSFKAAFYRITCPDSATLGNYHLGLLAGDEATEIATHLTICPHCTQEISQLAAFLRETAVSLEPTPVERIKVWIAKRLPTGGQDRGMVGTPAFATRGEENGPLMFEAGEAQLSLEIQDDPEHPGRKTILGLVLGIETEEVEARLIQEEQVVSAEMLDSIGNFTFANLKPGNYSLTITGEAIEIHLPEVTI